MPNPTALWVTVEKVQMPRTHWTYTLTHNKPGSQTNGTLRDRLLSPDKVCRTYTELCAWLHTYGVTPPPPEYFAPTPQELDEGAESILRQVMRRLR